MTRKQKVRRVLILCCHFLRNHAFYKAGWKNGVCIRDSQFWITVNGNFLDQCVLEWCKLFGDANGKHYWRKIITDQQKFFNGLLAFLRCTEQGFDDYKQEMRAYRDRFVAHLDANEIMEIPRLRKARKSVAYLYNYILAYENDGAFFPERPPTASDYYAFFVREGKEVYA